MHACAAHSLSTCAAWCQTHASADAEHCADTSHAAGCAGRGLAAGKALSALVCAPPSTCLASQHPLLSAACLCQQPPAWTG